MKPSNQPTIVTVETVHPGVTIVKANDQPTELPTAWFAERPVAGQTWNLTFERVINEQEKIDQLNQYLKRT